jgi:hypothetical protein
MRRKTVDCPSNNCDTVLASFNYLQSIKEKETLIILLIKVALVRLTLKFRTRCPIHRTHWKAIPCDNNYNNKSGPDWKLPSPCPSYGRPERPAMSTGKWLRPMGTNKWRPLSIREERRLCETWTTSAMFPILSSHTTDGGFYIRTG